MNISDIIKKDSDRVFQVDNECIILYTGDSLQDDKPFIRIGTWINMPVELIPFIENIIISDKIMGNPAYEQFNIDVRFLETNRYIGSENIVKRFLDFQKLFGLDLNNSSIVNIEKDLPQLSSKEKNISQKNHFIGVFYQDGNFKISHGKKDVVNLNEIHDTSYNTINNLQQLQKQIKSPKQYKNSGFVIIQHTPIFFNKGNFISYLFPSYFQKEFSELSINPDKIKEVIHPSSNFISITNLIKWKDHSKSNLKIFSDDEEHIKGLRKLYTKCNITREDFTGLKTIVNEGLVIENYLNTFNIKLKFSGQNIKDESIEVAYIKASGGADKIIKEKLDAIIINYTAYEELVLLFKSITTPFIILDDGNPNCKKLRGRNIPITQQGSSYVFEKSNDLDYVLKETACSSILGEIKDDTIKNLSDEIKLFDTPSYDEIIYLKNIKASLNAILSVADDRSMVSKINSLTTTINQKLRGHENKYNFNNKCIIFNKTLVIATEKSNEGKNIFIDDMNKVSATEFEMLDDKQKLFYDHIIEDRIRLKSLLDLYLQNVENSKEFTANIRTLQSAIEERRDLFISEAGPGTIPDIVAVEDITSVPGKTSNNKNSSGQFVLLNNKRIIQLSAASIIIIAAILLYEFRPWELLLTDNNEYNKITINDKSFAKFSKKDKDILNKIITSKIIDEKKKPQLIEQFKKMVKKKEMLMELQKNKDRKKTNNTIDKNRINGINNPGNKANSKLDSKKDKNNNIDGNKNSTGSNDQNNITLNSNIGVEKMLSSILVSNNDIYIYANKVAVKNGYRPLSYRNFNKNNPHWIYPSNIFTMLDGTRVTVKKGDTLWYLSKIKLIEADINFKIAIEKYMQSSGSDKKESLKLARHYAFSKKHLKIIKILTEEK